MARRVPRWLLGDTCAGQCHRPATEARSKNLAGTEAAACRMVSGVGAAATTQA
jgi:hypothetical protein